MPSTPCTPTKAMRGSRALKLFSQTGLFISGSVVAPSGDRAPPCDEPDEVLSLQRPRARRAFSFSALVRLSMLRVASFGCCARAKLDPCTHHFAHLLWCFSWSTRHSLELCTQCRGPVLSHGKGNNSSVISHDDLCFQAGAGRVLSVSPSLCKHWTAGREPMNCL